MCSQGGTKRRVEVASDWRERAGRDDVYSMYEMHLETLAGNGTPSATARIAARLLLGTEALAR